MLGRERNSSSASEVQRRSDVRETRAQREDEDFVALVSYSMSFKNLNFIFQSTLVTILRYIDTFFNIHYEALGCLPAPLLGSRWERLPT